MKNNVRIELFFSRYHPTENSEPLLLQEIKNIYRLKHSLYMEQEHCIRVCYDHLSTDVASKYWHEHYRGTTEFNDFLRQKQAIDKQTLYPFPVDNLCLYTPKELSLKQLTHIEILAQSLEYIERFCHELFHILFHLTGTRWIDLLDESIRHISHREGFIFEEAGHGPMVGELFTALVEQEELSQIAFLADLVNFSLKKQQVPSRNSAKSKINDPNTVFQLTANGFSIHQHDYLDLSAFLERLEQEQSVPLSYQRTVYLYTGEDIIALPHRTYRASFQFFEAGGTKAGFEQKLAQVMEQKTAGRFLDLMERLLHSGILRPIEGG